MGKKKNKPQDKEEPSTPYERFQDLARRLFAVPKSEIDQQAGIEKKQKEPKSN